MARLPTPAQRWAQIKIGTVSRASATTLEVVVSGATIEAAYLESYDTPAEGDQVALARQDSSWLCLGKVAGVGRNLVQNPSFEADGANPMTPSSWLLYVSTGTAQAETVQPDITPPAGQYAAQLDPTGSAYTAELYSSPIPAVAGQRYAISAYCLGVADPTGVATLRALGFAADTDLMPSATEAATAATVAAVGTDGWTAFSGTVTLADPSTQYLRVGLQAITASGGMQFDFVVCRRLT